MMPKRWHEIGLVVAVGIVATTTVGASLGPDSIGFWTGELLAWVLPRPLSDTMYWRVTEGVTVAVMALPGLVPALFVCAEVSRTTPDAECDAPRHRKRVVWALVRPSPGANLTFHTSTTHFRESGTP